MSKKCPLSYNQTLLLNEQLSDLSSPHLNIGGYLLVNGKMNPFLFQQAVKLVIQENDILRTVIIKDKNEYYQEVQDIKHEIFIKDFSNKKKLDKECIGWIKKRFDKPFNIFGKKIFEIGLLLSKENSFFYSIYNHLIVDGNSVSQVAKMIVNKYEAFINQKKVVFQKNISFLEIMQDDYTYKSSKKYKQDSLYWEEKAKLSDNYSYNITNKRRNKKISDSFFIEHDLDEEYFQKIEHFCTEHHITFSVFFIMILAYLIKHKTQENKILFNMKVQSRKNKLYTDCVGLFSSIMPILLETEEDIGKFLLKIKKEIISNYKHHKCSMEEFYSNVVMFNNKEINEAISYSYEPFDYDYSISGDEIKPFTLFPSKITDLLIINVRSFEKTKRFTINICFDKNLISKTEAKIFIEQFHLLTNKILSNTCKNLSIKNFFTNTEKKILQTINKNQGKLNHQNLVVILRNIFLQNYFKTALICKGRKYSYQELLKITERISSYLLTNNYQENNRIAVYLDYSIEMIATITAIIISGNVFIPLSKKDPINRIKKILQDSESQLLISDEIINVSCKQTLIKDILSMNKVKYNEESLFKDNIDTHSLIYIIYTSGSTGEPKGVLNSHLGVVNVLEQWTSSYDKYLDKCILLQTSSFAHDVFIGNYLKTIAIGGTLVLPTEEERFDLLQLSKIFNSNRVTVLDTTPSLVMMLVNFLQENNIDDSSLKLIIVGSDVCSLENFRILVAKYASQAMIVNSYGVSESAIYSMDLLVKTKNELIGVDNLFIGKPYRNTSVYILNDKFEQLNIGSIGELYLAGYGLAKGYTSDFLTKEKFLELPNIGRVYKTGDLARVDYTGNIEFIGRKDFMIKIRGYRIEPLEIENILETHKDIMQSVVVVKEKDVKKIIIAYYLGTKELDRHDIFLFLKNYLPEYMIPSQFIKLDSFPLSINGKIDRLALIKRNDDINKDIQIINLETTDAGEKQILKVWKEVLGQRFSLEKSFLEMGGDSLEAIKIASAINLLDYQCSYLDVYRSFSVKDFFNVCFSPKKYKDINLVNKELVEKFQVKILQKVHPRIKENINYLETEENLNPANIEKILSFSQQKLDAEIIPQYIYKCNYPNINNQEAKKILAKLTDGEKKYFQDILAGGELYSIIDKKYLLKLRKFKINSYFVSFITANISQKSDLEKAIKSLLSNNDLLRAILLKNNENKYFWKVFKDNYKYEIPFLDFSGYEVFSAYDFIHNVLRVYYSKLNDFRMFMFRVIFIKINLTQIKVGFLIDNAIHDDYSSSLIHKYLLDVSQNGFFEYPNNFQYKCFLDSFSKDFSLAKQKEIISKLDLISFKKQLEIFSKFINSNKQTPTSYNFNFSIKSSDIDDFAVAIKLFLIFLNFSIPFIHVPIIFFHNARRIDPEKYSNTIGDFIDRIPIMIDASLAINDNIRKIKDILSYVNNEGIFFKDVLYDNYNQALQKLTNEVVNNLENSKDLILFVFNQISTDIDEITSPDINKSIPIWLSGIRFSVSMEVSNCRLHITTPFEIDKKALDQEFIKSLNIKEFI
jgi:amino acid adenylation domain-containing protein